MNLWEVPVEDVRHLFGPERRELLDLLTSLGEDEWQAPSAAPGWDAKDLALHLLDDDLGWLSRLRDRDRSGLLTTGNHASFVGALAAKNQRWIDGARQLSRPVVIGLLEWSGAEMDQFYAGLDLMAEGNVGWASNGPVLMWFDIAQDLTERWVHQQQLREAVGRTGDYAERYLPVVLRTFAWALPHQFLPTAHEGTSVQVDLEAGGVYALTSRGAGRWEMSPGRASSPAALVAVTTNAAWRWFTGGEMPKNEIDVTGPKELLAPLLRVRAIIV